MPRPASARRIWKRYTNMAASDVTDRLDLAQWLDKQAMDHVRRNMSAAGPALLGREDATLVRLL